MTEQPQTPDSTEDTTGEAPGDAWTPPPAQPLPPPSPSEPSLAASTAAAADRPEIAVGAAFAGGFVLAMILKRLAR